MELQSVGFVQSIENPLGKIIDMQPEPSHIPIAGSKVLFNLYQLVGH